MFFGSKKKPKGPNFSKTESVEGRLSGTKISFLKPCNNAKPLVVNGKSIRKSFDLVSDINIYDKSLYISSSEERLGLALAKGEYSYKGRPLLDSYIGGMEFLASVNYVLKSPTLLDPKNYERSVLKELKLTYAPSTADDDWLIQFPLFWQVVILPQVPGTKWICYAVQEMACSDGDQLTYFFRTAISPEHELVFKFRTMSDDYNSGAFDLFKKIAKFIINSINLSHSESTMLELKEISTASNHQFSETIDTIRYEHNPKNKFVNYKIVDNPNIHFKKTINRFLF